MSQKKRVRETFRRAVLARDNYTCRKCGARKVPLDAHHITDRDQMPNGGYVIENGISLCNLPDGCHEKAERWHATQHEQVVPGYHPDELYAVIGSSWEVAWRASEALSISSTDT